MRLFTKWHVSHRTVMRLAADAWVVFPDGVGRTYYLLDREGARNVLSADFVFRYLLVLLVLVLLLHYVSDTHPLSIPLEAGFTALGIYIAIKRLRTAVFEREGRKRFPSSVPADSLQRIRTRREFARFESFAGSSHLLFGGMAVFFAAFALVDQDWGSALMVAIFLINFDLHGPTEFPTGGSGRVGLEDLWQDPSPEAQSHT